MDDQALKDYFLFDDVDLNANRSGRLSEKQRMNLVKDDREANKIVIGLGILFLVIALIWPLISIIIPLFRGIYQPSVDWGAIIWVLVWGGLGCFCLYSFFNNITSISKIIIKKVEGPVRFVAMGGGSDGGEIYYILRIGKTKLDDVDDEARRIMKEGDTYTAYYYYFKGGDGNHILSLEQLEASPSKK